jgi:hypothetical protein
LVANGGAHPVKGAPDVGPLDGRTGGEDRETTNGKGDIESLPQAINDFIVAAKHCQAPNSLGQEGITKWELQMSEIVRRKVSNTSTKPKREWIPQDEYERLSWRPSKIDGIKCDLTAWQFRTLKGTWREALMQTWTLVIEHCRRHHFETGSRYDDNGYELSREFTMLKQHYTWLNELPDRLLRPVAVNANKAFNRYLDSGKADGLPDPALLIQKRSKDRIQFDYGVRFNGTDKLELPHIGTVKLLPSEGQTRFMHETWMEPTEACIYFLPRYPRIAVVEIAIRGFNKTVFSKFIHECYFDGVDVVPAKHLQESLKENGEIHLSRNRLMKMMLGSGFKHTRRRVEGKNPVWVYVKT